MSAINSVIATINGVQHTLIWDASESAYVASFNAPSVSSWSQTDHKFGISVTATDTAGNSTTVDRTHQTFGSSLALRVTDTTDPTLTFTYPTSGTTTSSGTPVVTISVADADPGIDLDTFSLQVDSLTPVGRSDCTITEVSGGYTITYRTPYLMNGSHTLAASISDYDGNSSGTVSVTFTVDVAPPLLTVNHPTDNLITNQTSVTVDGVTNNSQQTAITLTVQVDSGSPQVVSVNDDGTFSTSVTVTNGSHTITVKSTDGVGYYSQVIRNITVDTTAPVFTEVSLSETSVSIGTIVTLKVKVSS